MSYFYPEALNAMEKIAKDLLQRIFPNKRIRCSVVADAVTGTASVNWEDNGWCLTVTINMPVRPATYRMSQDEFDHWAAYVLHEIGHPAHTCKITWDMAVRRNAHRLLNSLEDVREEKATIDLGLANNALSVFSRLIDMLHTKAIADGYDPNRPESIGWTLSTLGRHANGYALDVSDIFAKLRPEGVVARIVSWAIPMLGQCRSTQDCLDLADKVVAAIAASKPKKPKKPEPKPAMPSSEPAMPSGEPADALEDESAPELPPTGESAPELPPTGESAPELPPTGESASLDPVEAKAEEPEADEPEPKPAMPSSEPAMPSGEPAMPSSEPAMPSGEPADALEDESAPELPPTGESASLDPVEAKAEEPEADEPEPEADEPEPEADEPFSDADIEETSLQPNEFENMSSHGADTQVTEWLTKILRREGMEKPREHEIIGRNTRGTVELVAGNSSKMGLQRALLARALKAEDRDSFDGGRSFGRLDRRALNKAAQGSVNVFGKRVLVEGYDTDVQVLVDGSSSMMGLKMEAASTLALVVSQAASQVGVECFVHMFSDAGLHAATKGRSRPVARKFGLMAMQAAGSTPLTESMIQAAKMQKQRAGNKRKIMFIVTDGACNNGTHVVKAAGEYIERTVGVEIANLHIGYTKPGMFRNEAAVRPDKVSEAGLKQLTQMLERGI